MTDRRGFLGAILLTGMAPAIARAGILMPISVVHSNRFVGWQMPWLRNNGGEFHKFRGEVSNRLMKAEVTIGEVISEEDGFMHRIDEKEVRYATWHPGRWTSYKMTPLGFMVPTGKIAVSQ